MVKLIPALADQETQPERSLLSREWERDKRIYKAAAKFAAEIGEEGIKALVPGGGLLVKTIKGVLDFSDATDETEFDAQIEELLTIGTESQDQIDTIRALAQLILARQDEILERLDTDAPPVGKSELKVIASRFQDEPNRSGTVDQALRMPLDRVVVFLQYAQVSLPAAYEAIRQAFEDEENHPQVVDQALRMPPGRVVGFLQYAQASLPAAYEAIRQAFEDEENHSQIVNQALRMPPED